MACRDAPVIRSGDGAARPDGGHRPSHEDPAHDVGGEVHAEIDARRGDGRSDRRETRPRDPTGAQLAGGDGREGRVHRRMAARPRRTHRWSDHRPRPPGVGIVRAWPVRQLLHALPQQPGRAGGGDGSGGLPRPAERGQRSGRGARRVQRPELGHGRERSICGRPVPTVHGHEQVGVGVTTRLRAECHDAHPRGEGGKHRPAEQGADPHGGLLAYASISRRCARTPWRSAYCAPPIAFRLAAPNPPSGPRNR